MKTKSDMRSFRNDFAALERSLSLAKKCGGVVMTPEMMIVELDLTPGKVARIERKNDVDLSWFGPAYAALKKHGLLPESRSWSEWLARYQQKRKLFQKYTRGVIRDS